jgi:hypothetical protein
MAVDIDSPVNCGPGRETGSGLSYLFCVSITTLIRTTSPARLRAGARAGVLAAAASVPLLTAAAALATSNHNYDGEDSGPGLTVLQTLGIYVGIPLGLFVLISFLVVLPGWVRGDRNRREVGWVAGNGSAATAPSGASPSSASSAEQSVSAGKSGGTGGASGSW